jgi:hypothetical protein
MNKHLGSAFRRTGKTALIVAVAAVAAVAGAWQPARAQEGAFALSFDGASDYVTLGQTASMIGSGWQTAKTASVWIKPTGAAVCTGPDPATCDAVLGDKPRSWGISRGTLGGNDRIWVWNYDGTFDAIGIEYTAGEWVQVALVQGGGVLKAYKNGLLVGTTASGASVGVAQGVLHFGGIINNASRNWTYQGEIDELQIWNTARTDAQVAQDATQPLTGGETGLVAYYRMSNGSGISLTDDSGHGWTGTLKDGGSGVAPDVPITWVSPGVFSGGGLPPNTPPVANPQSLTTAEDVAAAITLTGSDADGDPLTFRIVTAPGHGSLTGTLPNIGYTPAANYNGADSFAFVANDGRADSAPQTVSLTVTPVNDVPVANDDAISVAIDTPVDVSVLTNDSDVDGDTLSISTASDPPHGAATMNGSQITYVPDSGFVGTDSFTYTISDGTHTDTAQVTVTVRPAGSDPGFALRFDGTSDFVSLAPTSSMMAAGWQTTKTVSLWVKPTGSSFCSSPNPGACDSILGDRSRWWGISRGVIGGLDRIWVWSWDTDADAVGIDYVVGEWVHIALVHVDGKIFGYKNGVLVGSVTTGATTQPLMGATPVLHLGAVINSTTKNWSFSGEIDEVQIWNVARSAGQIAQDMSQPLLGTEPGLAAYYRMTNGSGTSLTDDSGHGWTGTLHDGGFGVPADGPITWVPSGAFTVPD